MACAVNGERVWGFYGRPTVGAGAVRWLSIGVLMLNSAAMSAPFTNGSFESGSQGWWVVRTSSLSDFVADPGYSTDGNNSYVFNANMLNGVGSLAQTFDTEAGQTYSVSFDYGSSGNFETGYPQSLAIDVRDGTLTSGGAGLIELSSSWIVAGTNVGLSAQQTGASLIATDAVCLLPQSSLRHEPVPENPLFGTISFRFTALSQTSTLVFSDRTGMDGQWTDGLLDNVRVTIPEPCAAILVLPALMQAARRCNRRRNMRHETGLNVRGRAVSPGAC